MTAPVADGAPWYLYFWPWFLVALMVISVAGSLATVYIAFEHRDIEVDRNVRVEPPDVQRPRGD